MNRFLVWLILISIALSRWIHAESNVIHAPSNPHTSSDHGSVSLAGINDLKSVLTTAPSTQPIPATQSVAPTGPNHDSSTVVLQQVRLRLKNLTHQSQELSEMASEIRKVSDTYAFPIGKLQTAVRTIEQIHPLQKAIEEDLAGLTVQEAGVSEVKRLFEQTKSDVSESEKVILPVYDKLIAALDPKNYPALGEDTKRLSDFVSMYSDSRILYQEPARAVILLAEIAQATREHDRIVKDYELLIRQQTDLGKRLSVMSGDFQQKRLLFLDAARQQQEDLPGQIDSELQQIATLAGQAVREHNPLLFIDQIPQKMDQISEKLLLLQSLDPDAAKPRLEQIGRVREDLTVKQQTLSQGIIDSNPMPADHYTGTDRKKIEQLAVEAWQKEQPDAEILAVRIPATSWKRETLWRFQNAWYFVDRSRLQVQLLIKHNEKLAVIRPINLWIDHTSQDEYKAFPMDGINDNLAPQRFLRLERIQPPDAPAATRTVTSVRP